MPRRTKKQDEPASELRCYDAWLPIPTWPKLWRMRRVLFLACAPAALALAGAIAESAAQSEAGTVTLPDAAILTKLSPLVYPPMALMGGIAGDVELSVVVRQDGTFESAEVLSGPTMLKQAALESAQHSQFECRSCTGASTAVRLVYTFELGPTIFCTAPDSRYPQVIQSQNHVTVVAQPVGTCDPAVLRTKVRSAKCLYLWKCGHHETVLDGP
jgi:TonB family protein